MLLITGGCGYIGSHIVKALCESGEEVVIIDNLSKGKETALLGKGTFIKGDIRDEEKLEEIVGKYPIETVIHMAALINAAESNHKQVEYREVNDKGSRLVWEIARRHGVKHYLYASSAAVYGTPQSRNPIRESDPLRPTNVYGETKLAGEKSLQEIVPENGSYGIFRFFNVGGAENKGRIGQSKDSPAIVPRLFEAAINNTPITINGSDYNTSDGTVVRDFIHVEDIARACVMALEHLRNGGESFIVNLGSAEVRTLKEVVQIVREITRTNILIKYGPRSPGDIEYSHADITKARTILGWYPKKSLEDIVRDGWNAYEK